MFIPIKSNNEIFAKSSDSSAVSRASERKNNCSGAVRCMGEVEHLHNF